MAFSAITLFKLAARASSSFFALYEHLTRFTFFCACIVYELLK